MVASGQVARIDTLASATVAVFAEGDAAGCRFIDVSMVDGMAFRVLPDRGLDISVASVAGVPIAWLSRVGDAAPASEVDRAADADGMGWLSRFTGGLLTTCGPDNIGLPSCDAETLHGLHGGWSDLRASNVEVSRDVVNAEIELRVVGHLVFQAAGARFEIIRTIVTRTGVACVDINDQITNVGQATEPIPMLYHLNFGSPLWAPGATVQFPEGTKTIPRTDHAAGMEHVACNGPLPHVGAQEYVYERVLPDSENVGVVVSNQQIGLRATVTWTSDSLPTSHQWVHPAAGTYALGIEPANAGLAGRAALRADGTLPTLAAGETRHFGVRVSVAAFIVP
jgi:Domain of unknown function (DUF4432)